MDIMDRKEIEIFCCYAREDQELLLKFKKHLKPLERLGFITVWSDIDINAGAEWENEIKKRLNSSHIILLFVSPDFMQSDYCYSTEMKRAMERHEYGEARVIPIILRPIRWRGAPFGKLQVLPTNAEPVTSRIWHTLDDAFFDVVEGIEKRVEELQMQLLTSVPLPRSSDKFDKFTERVRKVLSLAREEAQRLQHNEIGPEHLLLGLVREGEGVAGKVLNNFGVELNIVRTAVESIAGRGERIVLGELRLTLHAKKAIELAVDEARRLNHPYIGTEHLLLGLIRVEEGIAVGVLMSLGVNLKMVRIQTIQVLSQRREGDYFTERVKEVLSLAREEALRFQHNYIGTEHLLLGLVREGEGVASKVLSNLGVELNKVQSAIEFIIGRGDRIVLGEIGLTPRGREVIKLAADEANRLNHHYIGTEHLLLGIMREGEGIAAGVLESMGVNLEMVRIQTIQVLSRPIY